MLDQIYVLLILFFYLLAYSGTGSYNPSGQRRTSTLIEIKNERLTYGVTFNHRGCCQVSIRQLDSHIFIPSNRSQIALVSANTQQKVEEDKAKSRTAMHFIVCLTSTTIKPDMRHKLLTIRSNLQCALLNTKHNHSLATKLNRATLPSLIRLLIAFSIDETFDHSMSFRFHFITIRAALH